MIEKSVVLPGPVRADQPDPVLAVHLQGGVGEQYPFAVCFADAGQSQHQYYFITSTLMPSRWRVAALIQAELGQGFVVGGQRLDFIAARRGEVALHLQDGVGGALAVIQLLLLGGQGLAGVLAGGPRSGHLLITGPGLDDVVINRDDDRLFELLERQQILLHCQFASLIGGARAGIADRKG